MSQTVYTHVSYTCTYILHTCLAHTHHRLIWFDMFDISIEEIHRSRLSIWADNLSSAIGKENNSTVIILIGFTLHTVYMWYNRMLSGINFVTSVSVWVSSHKLVYPIKGKFGKGFNLAKWQVCRISPNLNHQTLRHCIMPTCM